MPIHQDNSRRKNKPYKISSEVTSSKCMMIFNDINSCNIFQRYCQDNQYPPLRANNRSGPQEMPCPALSGANFNPTVTVPRQQTQRRTQQKYMKIYENIWKHKKIYENIWKFLISFPNLFISYHIEKKSFIQVQVLLSSLLNAYIWVRFPRTGKISKMCPILSFLKLDGDQTVWFFNFWQGFVSWSLKILLWSIGCP